MVVVCWYYPAVLMKQLGQGKKILKAASDPDEVQATSLLNTMQE
jgi:hypothetical protein